jgi:hypothetical protein
MRVFAGNAQAASLSVSLSVVSVVSVSELTRERRRWTVEAWAWAWWARGGDLEIDHFCFYWTVLRTANNLTCLVARLACF